MCVCVQVLCVCRKATAHSVGNREKGMEVEEREGCYRRLQKQTTKAKTKHKCYIKKKSTSSSSSRKEHKYVNEIV